PARGLAAERPQPAPPPPSPTDSAPPGAARPRADAAATPADGSPEEFFLPDFCSPRSAFAVVLVAELLAVALALARPGSPFLTELASVSLFVQWLALTSAALLCFARPRLARSGVARASVAVFVLLVLNTALISVAALWLGAGAEERGSPAPLLG